MTSALHLPDPIPSDIADADAPTVATRTESEVVFAAAARLVKIGKTIPPRKKLPTPLGVERVATDGELDQIAAEWNGLAGNNPFRRWEWLEAWWRHFRTRGDELFVLAIRDGAGRLIGLAPWYLTHSPFLGRVVRFLGSGRVCSDYLGVLCVAGCERSVAAVLADWLISSTARGFQTIELTGVRADDESMAQLCAALAERDYQVHQSAGMNCWRVELPASWEEYLLSLSKSRRERVRQLCRRQFDTGRAVLKMVESSDDLNRGWTILLDLHQRRQRSLGRPGCFECPRFTGFLREAAERFLQLGRLRLQWIELEGQPIAVELDLDADEAIFFYQSGIAPEVADERPGWLGTIAALRRAQQEGRGSFDFLRGDESYKSHWRAAPIPLVDLRIVRPTPIARLQHWLWLVQEACKRQIKNRWLKKR